MDRGQDASLLGREAVHCFLRSAVLLTAIFQTVFEFLLCMPFTVGIDPLHMIHILGDLKPLWVNPIDPFHDVCHKGLPV